MKDINKVILIGRLGADPVQRQTKSGTSVTHFSLATSRKFNKEASATEPASLVEETQWHQIVSWGKQAEACTQFLKKGNPVYVEGMIRSHEYADKAGANRTRFEIHADTVSFL